MNINDIENKNTVTLISTINDWIDGKAVAQLHSLAKLDGVARVIGLPDLHPGRGIPIGAAILTEKIIYPHLIGNDIGCGMSLWKTNLESHKVKLDKFVKILTQLSEFKYRNNDLGSLGGGNHFIELQKVDKILKKGPCYKAGIDKNDIMLLTHSGSRSMGQMIYRKYAKNSKGLKAAESQAINYLLEHDQAVSWAKENRKTIATEFLKLFKVSGRSVLDLCHNSISKMEIGGVNHYLHRKGATPVEGGLVVIPGSRGSYSYLVKPSIDQVRNLFSLPHGAGRKWSRSECKDRLLKRFSPEALKTTSMGNRVICSDKNLLYQEAPEAYKDIEKIINSLVEMELVEVVALLKPIITYKGNF